MMNTFWDDIWHQKATIYQLFLHIVTKSQTAIILWCFQQNLSNIIIQKGCMIVDLFSWFCDKNAGIYFWVYTLQKNLQQSQPKYHMTCPPERQSELVTATRNYKCLCVFTWTSRIDILISHQYQRVSPPLTCATTHLGIIALLCTSDRLYF